MLFGEIIRYYPEKHTKLTNIIHGYNAELLNVKASGIYSYHCALNGNVEKLVDVVAEWLALTASYSRSLWFRSQHRDRPC
jgi:hypothetical protein